METVGEDLMYLTLSCGHLRGFVVQVGHGGKLAGFSKDFSMYIASCCARNPQVTMGANRQHHAKVLCGILQICVTLLLCLSWQTELLAQ